MKKILYFTALVALTLFSSCSDEEFAKSYQVVSGDEIIFGSRTMSELENSRITRTIYTGSISKDENNVSYEGINWVAGDQVRVYCAQSPEQTKGDYDIVDITTGEYEVENEGVTKTYEYSTASLAKTSDVGLRWGDVTQTHHFYAVYPSPAAESSVTDGQTGVVNFNIPSGQEAGNITSNNGNYLVNPNMKHAYMVAYNAVNPSEVEGGIELDFKPVVTAVRFTVTLPDTQTNGAANTDPFYIRSINVMSKADANGNRPVIAGSFSCNIATGALTAPTTGYSSVSLDLTSKEHPYGVELQPGKSITFTTFLLSNVDLKGLDISFLSVGKTLNAHIANSYVIPFGKKTYISFHFPKELKELQTSSWLSQLPDQMLLNKISVPGTGGSWSYNITDDASKQQILDFNTQWDLGVRCFELSTDGKGKPSQVIFDTTYYGNFGASEITCNFQKCPDGDDGVFYVSDAISSIASKLDENPTEFAILVITYQPSTATQDRDAATWAERFTTYFTTIESTINGLNATGETTHAVQKFSSDLTLGEVRGDLMIILRSNSMGIDCGWWTGLKDNPDKVISIAGWGSHPDQWFVRGFGDQLAGTNGAFEPTITANTGSGVNVSGVNTQKRPYSTTEMLTYTKGISDFGYYIYDGKSGVGGSNAIYSITEGEKQEDGITISINDGYSNGKKAWVQEWRRVSKESKKYGGYYWPASWDEKIEDIKEADTKARTNDGAYSVYVNSLCGYYVDASISRSYTPYSTNIRSYYWYETDGFMGINATAEWRSNAECSNRKVESGTAADGGYAGNIAGFASDVNKTFYAHRLDVDAKVANGEYTAGPTGIVLMDRVQNDMSSTDDAVKASTALPSMILQNNVKYYQSALKPATRALTFPLTDDEYSEENGGIIAAPVQRGVKGADEGVSIVWE